MRHRFDRGNKQPPGPPPEQFGLPKMPQEAHGVPIINPDAAGAEQLICPECGKSAWTQVVGVEVKYKLKGAANLSIFADISKQQVGFLCVICGNLLSLEVLLNKARLHQKGEENADS